jgi:membrane protease YdiL (CAAX protease family)
MHFEFPVACIIIGFVFGLTLGYLTKKEEDKFISTTE